MDRPVLRDVGRGVPVRDGLGVRKALGLVQLRWTQLRCAVLAGRIEWCRIDRDRAEREWLASSLGERFEAQFTWRR